ncbi:MULTISPECIES: aldehyde dehydrogenase [unclassified Achromobacter]|uniref:aldehyde dehydrogenase n=1 Tax=unclassified Achromobacter TaxID=2626865 RepID=UPI000B51D7F7|nr:MULTISPECIES: aldehyde dehydrogenase [unclassified Achromobacter]OWT80699.1 aldehyde dehydrogenase PuuC [Achromobacter sp. HZ34]OWT81215.1 aldehyde dehydrogenase PuuC [Achromobacter sp. HZ28]
MNHLHDLAYWRAKADQLSFRTQAYIDGQWTDASDGATFDTLNPATGQVLAKVAACGVADVDRAVAAARRAFERGVWAELPRTERKAALLRLAALIDTHREELAVLETVDMGKPIADTLQYDIPEAARTYAWYGEAIDKLYDEIAPTAPGTLATITREPVGVVAAVVPWNYPLLMASWKVAPALAMGNSVVLKPAEQSPLTALRLAELAAQAGIPAGVFNVVPGLGPAAGQALGRHADVDCIAFTGSTATGKRFMEYAGQSNLKRVWLECGGKSPHIIFDDCPDLDRAAQAAAIGIFNNQGEICIAGSRLYVQDGIYDAFMAKLDSWAARMQPGDPLDPASAMGAIVDAAQLGRVLSYVQAGQAEGARLRTGGATARPETGGFYLQPTIFECASQAMRIVREEIFGPVLAVTRFSTEEEALRMANDTPYGLGSGLWTANLARAHRVSKKLRAGLVWVNCYMDGDVTVPFGGVKQSGSGRDKSLHALDKYTDLKTTWISLV